MNSFNSMNSNLVTYHKTIIPSIIPPIIPPIIPHVFTQATKYASTSGATTINNSSISLPEGLCIDSNSNIYFCNVGSGKLFKIDTSNNTLYTTFATALPAANHTTVCIDNSDNMHTLGYTNTSITNITPNGTVTTLTTAVGPGVGIVTDNSYNLYICKGSTKVTMYPFNGSSYDTGVVIAGNGSTTYASATTNTTFAIDLVLTGLGGLFINNGKIYVCSTVGFVFYIQLSAVYAYVANNPTKAVMTKFAGTGTNGTIDSTTGIDSVTNALNQPGYGMAFDNAGNAYICCYVGSRIMKVTPELIMTTFIGPTTTSTIQISSNNNGPFGICINKTYDTMYFSSTQVPGTIWKVT